MSCADRARRAVPSDVVRILSNMCSIDDKPPDDLHAAPGKPLEVLEREITELAAHINAATCRWLGLVAEFDRREGWAEWGYKSCTHWLSYRCGLSPATAREQVRVARRLEELPAIRHAFAHGELCYSQVRAITRAATPEFEGHLVEIARHATAVQLETVVRAYRGVLEVELGAAQPLHRRRYVRCEHGDDGSLLISARLPAEEGALVLSALEAGRDTLRQAGAASAETGASAETTQTGDKCDAQSRARERSGDEAPGEGGAISNADALLLMAQTLITSGASERTGADGYGVVVHVDAATLADDEEGACELAHGPRLHPETARRLACDASLVRILERDGRPLSVGRRTRSVPPALRRALRSRDRTCRFPGCGQRRFLHAHHVDHWARGGRTDLSNLVQLCGFHHHLVHEGGYTLEPQTRGGVVFRRPDGRAVHAVVRRPRGEPGELRQRHRRQRLALDASTCMPQVSDDRFRLAWVVDALADSDPRLRE
jgi:hypothetical protein